jgi:hypothetical protein
MIHINSTDRAHTGSSGRRWNVDPADHKQPGGDHATEPNKK